MAGGGCASEVTQLVDEGSGGSTSTSTTSSTGAPAACPDSLPENGEVCEGSESCTFVREQCADDATAACVDGHWDVMNVASCEPLPTSAGCDLYGTWRVVVVGDWEPPVGAGYENWAEGFYDIVIAHGAGGGVVMTGNVTSIDPGACTWHTGWTLDYYEDSDPEMGWWAEWIELEIDVTIVGDTGTGTVKIYCWGECGGESISTVTVERVSP